MLDGTGDATESFTTIVDPATYFDVAGFPWVDGDDGSARAALAAGGSVLSGMCFYQSYAREMAEANGWKRLATNSAKLVNILGGYGYRPALLSMNACIEAACRDGRVAP